MKRKAFFVEARFCGRRGALAHIAAAFISLRRKYGVVLSVSVAVMLCGMGIGLPAIASDWIPTGELGTARYRHSATRLQSGLVLVAGGGDGRSALDSSELYNPQAGTWDPTANLNIPRILHRAVMLQDGRVLVAGGQNASSEAMASSELYDPSMGEWTQVGNLNQARTLHTATLLQDGRVLVAGGCLGHSFVSDFLASAEIFDPDSLTWTLTGEMESGRYRHTATLLPDGRVLVAGGLGDNEYIVSDLHETLAAAEIYDPATGQWSRTADLVELPLPTGRARHTATRLLDGRVLVAGNMSYFGTSTSGVSPVFPAELFDPVTETWSLTESLNDGRYFHSATLLADGSVLAAGGNDLLDYFGSALASAEVYDSEAPATGFWGFVGDLATARSEHTATLLKDGRVLIAGGMGDDEALSSAEIYPSAGDPLSVSITLSSTSFGPGDTLVVGLEAFSAEQDFMTDVYFGAVMPDGESLVFITNIAAPTFSASWLGADARSFAPLYEDLRVPLGFDYRNEGFFSYTLPDGLPEGEYGMFLALIPPGALEDGSLDAGDLLELGMQHFSYQR